ncbi:MAG TPA: hypothetical protein VHU92_13890 [Streptosporangiaceae bacterium]|jgi:hypothetical protein|nr:hypothetical protein [Streptosporangiaceae bacterium]
MTAPDAEELRGALRRDLTAALKARQPDAVAALRIAIAAIDNAQAIAVPAGGPAATSSHIAGASPGAGSAEAARRPLSRDELQAILRGQIDELTREADRYDTLGRAGQAGRLRDQARLLAAYLLPPAAGC